MIMLSKHVTDNPAAAALTGSYVAILIQRVRGFGPYLLIELIMPGGTLLALSLYLYRRWHAKTGSDGSSLTAALPAPELCAAALLIGAMVACGRFCCAKRPGVAHHPQSSSFSNSSASAEVRLQQGYLSWWQSRDEPRAQRAAQTFRLTEPAQW
jgi:hypothetical protein